MTNADSIVDQDAHVVLASVAIPSFLSQQESQGDIIGDYLDEDSYDNNNNNHLEWSIILLLKTRETTLSLLSVKLDYQLALEVQMLLQV